MRAYITVVIIIINTLVIGSIVALAGIFDRGGRVYDIGSRLWAWAIRICAGIKVKIKGLEHLDKNKSYIFMSNHQSHLDAVAWATNLPFRIRFFAKKELTYVPIFGQAIYMSRHIIIDRKNIESAMKSIEKARDMIKRYGLSVLVFPEGTRSITGGLGEFKKGGFVLALETGIPIVPMAVQGSFELLPPHTMKIRPGQIRLNVGKPISMSDYTFDTKQSLIDRVRNEIQRLASKA
jgi:1-acyl-sn-glycerol-3-phosphate acyltransferase